MLMMIHLERLSFSVRQETGGQRKCVCVTDRLPGRILLHKDEDLDINACRAACPRYKLQNTDTVK